jgi:class 3 adenylate cyclase
MATEMNEQAKSMGIDIRIGVNSGECIVGNFGSNDRMDYSVIGPEVNLAARLESSSEPRKIQISSKTYELVLDQFACTERGSINLKGIEREVKTYWVS